MSKFNSAGLEPQEHVMAAISAVQPKQPAAPTREQFAAKSAWQLGRAIGVPLDAAVYILWLEGRILTLEERLAKLDAPPHMQNVEKRG
jgi:hypothetical protein